MRSTLLLMLVLLFASCNGKTSLEEDVPENKPESAAANVKKAPVSPSTVEVTYTRPTSTETSTPKALDSSQVPGASVALNFMKSYVDFCNERKQNAIEWVNRSQYVTQSFKAEHRSLLEEAWKDDPELGLEFDPIFDAQEYPEKGVMLIEADKDGYMTLKGIDWPEFTVVVKVKKEGNKWLVDGAGVLNVPESRRAAR